MRRHHRARRAGAPVLALVLVTTAAALPASASSGRTAALTVVTLGRNGRPVRTQPELISRHGLYDRRVPSGHATKLKPGTYDVLVDVYGPDGTDTMAARRVVVRGTKTITIDARKGRAIRARLKPAPPAGYEQNFQMDLCDAQAGSILGWTLGKVLYVIPTKIHGVELAYSSVWQPAIYASHAPRFLASAVHHHGLPHGGIRTFRQSALATVTVHARRGPTNGSPDIELDGRSFDDDICVDGTRRLDAHASLPYSFTAHLPAGDTDISERGSGYLSGPLTAFRAGHHYRVTLNRAAWGPSGRLPYVWSGHNIYLNTAQMLVDPVLTDDGPSTHSSYRLRTHGETIVDTTVSGDNRTLNPKLHSRGWYTLTVAATRRAGADTLSTASRLKLHFYADPGKVAQVRGYLTEFRPAGLDADNQAPRSRITTVALQLQRRKPDDSEVRQLPDDVRSVRVWRSPDGGQSWHAVRVTEHDGSWAAHVPGGTGRFVSLRSTVTDTHGSTSTTTVVRAYAVR